MVREPGTSSSLSKQQVPRGCDAGYTSYPRIMLVYGSITNTYDRAVGYLDAIWKMICAIEHDTAALIRGVVSCTSLCHVRARP